jgi:F0F1-type ATP synthase membrane subunit b/b'
MDIKSYRQQAEDKIKEYQVTVQAYREKEEHAASDAKQDLDRQIIELQARLDEAKERVIELADTAKDSCSEIISDVGDSVESLTVKIKDLLGRDDDSGTKH